MARKTPQKLGRLITADKHYQRVLLRSGKMLRARKQKMQALFLLKMPVVKSTYFNLQSANLYKVFRLTVFGLKLNILR